MPKSPTQSRALPLLIALLDALEEAPSAARRQSLQRIRAKLQRELPAMEHALPLASDDAHVLVRGTAYSAPRLAVHGGRHSRHVQRRAIIRTIRLLLDEDAVYAPPVSPALQAASLIGASVGRFSDRHPILATIIILAVLFVTIWRESFQLTTKFAGTEITITGQHTPPAEQSYPALPEVFGPSTP